MNRFGLVRVAAVSPVVAVGNPGANAAAIAGLLQRAAYHEVDVLVFPELCLTGYTCGDLFRQQTLLDGALRALEMLIQASRGEFNGLFAVGLPIAVDGLLFNAAALIQRGEVLGIVPKAHLPTYGEFYERRWFAPADRARAESVLLGECRVPFGVDLLFACPKLPDLKVGVELCEDLWVPIPPSSRQALAGATLLLNLSASNECTAKSEYRRQLVTNQSGRCVAAYVYAAAGVGESTTDLVFGGHCLIAENGALLAEQRRFLREPQLLLVDVDVERLAHDRRALTSFADNAVPSDSFRVVEFDLAARPAPSPPIRPLPAHPFVPPAGPRLEERCREIFETQVAALAKRIEAARPACLRIGVSGGLDSTLALLAAAKTCDALGLPRSTIRAVSMPGFGTTARTQANARRLAEAVGAGYEVVDIRPLALRTFCDLNHRPFGVDPNGVSVDEFQKALEFRAADAGGDLVLENVQARMRTLVLMSGGFVVGTGDLSELVLGWCTYNGDQMSMYNPNVGIPKTLVRFLVRWAAENEFDGEARDALLDVAATEISPELLPAANGRPQRTEASTGPYELVDFFLYHVLRWGMRPAKIAYLAFHARFDVGYDPAEIVRWLGVFIRRFFASQFKRSCLPDGPKIGSVAVSPRGDWRMPSDADAGEWLAELATLENRSAGR